MEIKRKIIISSILTLILIMSVLFPCFAVQSDIEFDNSPVMDDLNNSNFNVYHYGFNEKGKPEILNFVEYCYSPFESMRENYGLYIYLYNPTNIKFNKDGFNSVQLATGDRKDTSDYAKYKLKHLSESSGDYKNLFHKFKILDPDNTIINNVSSNKRIYNVSGIELDVINGTVTDYGIGGQYIYTGYAKGYGNGNDVSTLESTRDVIDTVRLNPQSTFYRLPGENANGQGHQDNLSSLYFAVDNAIADNYDSLSGVHLIWDEFQTAPIIVTNDETRYNALLNAQGVDMGWFNNDICQYGFRTKFHYNNSSLYWNTSKNIDANAHLKTINAVKYTKKDITADNYVLSSNEILELWKSYNKTYNTGKTPGGKYSMDLFKNSVDTGRTVGGNDVWIRNTESWELESYTFKNGWDRFWQKLFGGKGAYNGIEEIKPLYAVTDKDRNADDVSSQLLIASSDVGAFNSYYDNAKKNSKTTYLVRFAITDYYASEIYFTLPTGGFDTSITRPKGLLTMQTAFLNTDILELEYRKGAEYYKIPAVSNPIDVVGGITPPWSPENGKHAKDWLYWIIIAILIVIVLTILNKTGILDLLVDGVKWLINMPFKAIQSLFKSKDDGDKGNIHIYVNGDKKATEQAKLNAKNRLNGKGIVENGKSSKKKSDAKKERKKDKPEKRTDKKDATGNT